MSVSVCVCDKAVTSVCVYHKSQVYACHKRQVCVYHERQVHVCITKRQGSLQGCAEVEAQSSVGVYVCLCMYVCVFVGRKEVEEGAEACSAALRSFLGSTGVCMMGVWLRV